MFGIRLTNVHLDLWTCMSFGLVDMFGLSSTIDMC
jgi:hypothetical protein